MPGNFRKDDLRIIKTYKALLKALQKLLKCRNFGRITVNDLCEEAQISRATFYAHFKDKYDLLEYWLKNTKSEIINKDKSYSQLEETVNQFVRDNAKIITNLLDDATNETLDLLHEFMISLLDINIEYENRKVNPKYTVLSSFCAGGMLNFLLWQKKNKFPTDLQMINTYFYSILKLLLKWEAEQD